MANSSMTGAVVIIKKNGEDGSKYSIIPQKLTIGTDPSCQIRFYNENIDEVHCTIIHTGDSTSVYNHSEQFPITVNDKVVKKSHSLQSGDVVGIGSRKLRWESYECQSTKTASVSKSILKRHSSAVEMLSVTTGTKKKKIFSPAQKGCLFSSRCIETPVGKSVTPTASTNKKSISVNLTAQKVTPSKSYRTSKRNSLFTKETMPQIKEENSSIINDQKLQLQEAAELPKINSSATKSGFKSRIPVPTRRSIDLTASNTPQSTTKSSCSRYNTPMSEEFYSAKKGTSEKENIEDDLNPDRPAKRKLSTSSTEKANKRFKVSPGNRNANKIAKACNFDETGSPTKSIHSDVSLESSFLSSNDSESLSDSTSEKSPSASSSQNSERTFSKILKNSSVQNLSMENNPNSRPTISAFTIARTSVTEVYSNQSDLMHFDSDDQAESCLHTMQQLIQVPDAKPRNVLGSLKKTLPELLENDSGKLVCRSRTAINLLLNESQHKKDSSMLSDMDTPRENSSVTRKSRKSSVINISGVESLHSTPKSDATANVENKPTSSFKTPRNRSSVNDLRKMIGIKSLFSTPNVSEDIFSSNSPVITPVTNRRRSKTETPKLKDVAGNTSLVPSSESKSLTSSSRKSKRLTNNSSVEVLNVDSVTPSMENILNASSRKSNRLRTKDNVGVSSELDSPVTPSRKSRRSPIDITSEKANSLLEDSDITYTLDSEEDNTDFEDINPSNASSKHFSVTPTRKSNRYSKNVSHSTPKSLIKEKPIDKLQEDVVTSSRKSRRVSNTVDSFIESPRKTLNISVNVSSPVSRRNIRLTKETALNETATDMQENIVTSARISRRLTSNAKDNDMINVSENTSSPTARKSRRLSNAVYSFVESPRKSLNIPEKVPSPISRRNSRLTKETVLNETATDVQENIVTSARTSRRLTNNGNDNDMINISENTPSPTSRNSSRLTKDVVSSETSNEQLRKSVYEVDNALTSSSRKSYRSVKDITSEEITDSILSKNASTDDINVSFGHVSVSDSPRNDSNLTENITTLSAKKIYRLTKDATVDEIYDDLLQGDSLPGRKSRRLTNTTKPDDINVSLKRISTGASRRKSINVENTPTTTRSPRKSHRLTEDAIDINAVYSELIHDNSTLERKSKRLTNTPKSDNINDSFKEMSVGASPKRSINIESTPAKSSRKSYRLTKDATISDEIPEDIGTSGRKSRYQTNNDISHDENSLLENVSTIPSPRKSTNYITENTPTSSSKKTPNNSRAVASFYLNESDAVLNTIETEELENDFNISKNRSSNVNIEPENDVTSVKKIRRTPKPQKEPENDLTDVSGVKKLLQTPKNRKDPENDLTNVAGVKKLMRTPKVQKQPENNLDNVTGVKQLLKTPKPCKEPKNDLTNVAGVKKLMRTPKLQKQPENNLDNVTGVKQLLKTPKPRKEPENDLTKIEGISSLFKMKKVQKAPKNDLSNVSLGNMFNEPSGDALFDELRDNTPKTPVRTYSNKKKSIDKSVQTKNTKNKSVSPRVIDWVEAQEPLQYSNQNKSDKKRSKRKGANQNSAEVDNERSKIDTSEENEVDEQIVIVTKVIKKRNGNIVAQEITESLETSAIVNNNRTRKSARTPKKPQRYSPDRAQNEDNNAPIEVEKRSTRSRRAKTIEKEEKSTELAQLRSSHKENESTEVSEAEVIRPLRSKRGKPVVIVNDTHLTSPKRATKRGKIVKNDESDSTPTSNINENEAIECKESEPTNPPRVTRKRKQVSDESDTHTQEPVRSKRGKKVIEEHDEQNDEPQKVVKSNAQRSRKAKQTENDDKPEELPIRTTRRNKAIDIEVKIESDSSASMPSRRKRNQKNSELTEVVETTDAEGKKNETSSIPNASRSRRNLKQSKIIKADETIDTEEKNNETDSSVPKRKRKLKSSEIIEVDDKNKKKIMIADDEKENNEPKVTRRRGNKKENADTEKDSMDIAKKGNKKETVQDITDEIIEEIKTTRRTERGKRNKQSEKVVEPENETVTESKDKENVGLDEKRPRTRRLKSTKEMDEICLNQMHISEPTQGNKVAKTIQTRSRKK